MRKDEMIAAGGRAIVKEMEFEDGAGASKDRERGSSCGGACSPLTLCTRDGTMRGRLYGANTVHPMGLQPRHGVLRALRCLALVRTFWQVGRSCGVACDVRVALPEPLHVKNASPIEQVFAEST